MSVIFHNLFLRKRFKYLTLDICQLKRENRRQSRLYSRSTRHKTQPPMWKLQECRGGWAERSMPGALTLLWGSGSRWSRRGGPGDRSAGSCDGRSRPAQDKAYFYVGPVNRRPCVLVCSGCSWVMPVAQGSYSQHSLFTLSSPDVDENL